jgi:hypothetical protein
VKTRFTGAFVGETTGIRTMRANTPVKQWRISKTHNANTITSYVYSQKWHIMEWKDLRRIPMMFHKTEILPRWASQLIGRLFNAAWSNRRPPWMARTWYLFIKYPPLEPPVLSSIITCRRIAKE